MDNSRGSETLLRQLVAVVREGRTFVHKARPLYWNEVRRVRRLGRRCLGRVYGDSSPEPELFAQLSGQAFEFLPERGDHIHKVEVIDGAEVIVVGGEENRVYHLNKLDWNNALQVLIEAAHRLRNEAGRHDHPPAVTPVAPLGTNLPKEIEKGAKPDPPELPPKLQNASESTKTKAEMECAQPGKRKRGRPQTIPDKKKATALKCKDEGGSNKDAAMIIYSTSYPTPQRVKNVSSILRNYRIKVQKTVN